MGCMADIYLLAGLTLPSGVAHEFLPGTVTLFMADCWPGMSRTQMIARAKRRGLRLSFRATVPCPSGGTGVFELRFNDGAGECLMLARLERVGNGSGGKRRTRRTDVSRPPPRDARQTRLF
jgi:putative component of toxin-antitoxin plasmid stabilization module